MTRGALLIPLALLCCSSSPPRPTQASAVECKPDGCPAPPRKLEKLRRSRCTQRDFRDFETVASLAAVGVIATGECDGVNDLNDCKAIHALAATVTGLARRLCQ